MSPRPRALTLLLGALACAPARLEERARAPETRTEVELTPLDAEVWAPELEVRLAPRPSGATVYCEVLSDRARVPTSKAGERFLARVPLAPGANRVRARCRDERGALAFSAPVTYTRRLGLHGLTVVDDVGAALARAVAPRAEREPSSRGDAWLEGAVFYGVIPALYGDSPLLGLKAELPRIAALGVRGLWVSPVFDAPPGDFGYAVTDYFRVRPELGTKEDLSRLIDEAHRLGLRVVLDFVPNHTSDQHPYFRQSAALGGRSHYFDFYERDARGQPRHYFDWIHLPNLEFTNPEVSRFMTASALYWLEAFGVDGYRVDAAWAIRERTPAFYDFFLGELRRVRASAFVLAEASVRDAFFLEHGFDAAYDWTGEIGEWAWQSVFAEDSGIAERLTAVLQETERRAPRNDRIFRFLNNNDTGARFISRHGLGLTRVATVLLLTLPGLPCVYAFDEMGGEFEPYAEPPRPKLLYPELREFHTRLIALRRELPALHGARMRVVATEPPAELFAYLRESPNGEHRAVLVVLNFGARLVRARVHLPETGSPLAFRRVFEAAGERLQGALPPIDLPAHGYAVFVAESP